MQINTVIFFELLDEIIHDAQVEVITTEEGIAAGGAYLENAITYIENGNIESTATKVVNGNNFIFLFIKSICERRSSWLINDAQNFKPCDLSSIFGGVALRIVEIRRHSDHSLCDRFTKIRFGIGLDLRQDHRRDFWRRIFLVIDLHAHVAIVSSIDGIRHTLARAFHFRIIRLASHKTLHRKYRVLRIGDRLIASN